MVRNVNLCNRCDHTFHGVEMASSDAYNNASLITRDYLCLYTSTTREHTEIPWCAPFMCPESVSKWRNFLPFYRTDKFWYMPQTYDTEELIFDNSVKRLWFGSKEIQYTKQYLPWISHKSFGDTLLEGESFGSVIEIFLWSDLSASPFPVMHQQNSWDHGINLTRAHSLRLSASFKVKSLITSFNNHGSPNHLPR